MSNIDTDDLETFLIEAELISQKVKALAENKMSPEEFDKLETARSQDKRKREEAVKRRQREAYERKRLGHEGKGIGKDFQNFCRFCHWEYQMPTPLCLRCKKQTMTLQQRQQQLEVMVEQYKKKKSRREERKMKWEMWQKTKAMLWKKTSNNYDKWDYFVSDSQQQPEKEPIVPKDDPNFKALERDMEERKAARIKETQKAKKLKQKGNQAMKQGDYEKAMEMYTLALQHIKDIKSVYTNRALAFIKLGKFKKAIKDCTNVIEYMEVFEKVEQNRDLVFKAYLRRAHAKKQLKDFKQSLEDCNKALSFCPQDKSAEILKKQVQGFLEHTQKVQKILRETKKNPESESKKEKQDQLAQVNADVQQKVSALPTEQESNLEQSKIIKELAEASAATISNKVQESEAAPAIEKASPKMKEENFNKKYDNPVEEIKDRLENLSQSSILNLFRLLKQRPELTSIFIAAKGIQKCLIQLVQAEECHKEGFLVSYCLRGDAVGEKQVWDFGIQKIYNRISEILDNPADINMGKYFVLEDIFEVLIPMSLHEKYRTMLADSTETHHFIERTFAKLITKHKKQPDVFSSFLVYFGNLCSGNSKLRDGFITETTLTVITRSLYEKVISKRTANRSQINVKKNVYSLLANLVISEHHRSKLVKELNETELVDQTEQPRWSQLIRQLKKYPKSEQNFDEYIGALLSFFANITLGTSLIKPDLASTISDRYLANPSIYSNDIMNKALLTISRLKFTDTSLFKGMLSHFNNHLGVYKHEKNQKNLMEHIVRILNFVYSGSQKQPRFTQPLPKALQQQLKLYISGLQYGQILFCNTCNLFCVMLDTQSELSTRIYAELLPVMKFLIDVAKDKVGNWRKNATILLAKLSLNAQCKQELYKHHGMDVLKSIAEFVKPK